MPFCLLLRSFIRISCPQRSTIHGPDPRAKAERFSEPTVYTRQGHRQPYARLLTREHGRFANCFVESAVSEFQMGLYK